MILVCVPTKHQIQSSYDLRLGGPTAQDSADQYKR